MAKRRWVRESDQEPMSAEAFRRSLAKSSGPVREADLAPPLVMFDMRGGNLERFDEYLKEHMGIPHPEVAAELSSLISGEFGVTKYRLIAIEHPDAPPPKAGPARQTVSPPTSEQLSLIAAFEKALVVERGKKHLAEEAVATRKKISVAKIKRARRAARDYEAAREMERQQLEYALEQLERMRASEG